MFFNWIGDKKNWNLFLSTPNIHTTHTHLHRLTQLNISIMPTINIVSDNEPHQLIMGSEEDEWDFDDEITVSQQPEPLTFDGTYGVQEYVGNNLEYGVQDDFSTPPHNAFENDEIPDPPQLIRQNAVLSVNHHVIGLQPTNLMDVYHEYNNKNPEGISLF